MIIAASLALAAAQPAVEAPIDNEITVVANRLRDWRGSWRLKKGAVTCKTKSSTGDKAIDAIGCDAMVACVTPLAPRFAELEASGLPKKDLTSRASALMTEEGVYDCLFTKRQAGIAALVAARRGKRT